MSNPLPTDTASSPDRSPIRRWIVLVVGMVFFALVMYQVLNPFPDQPYMEVPHGDHVHYVPKDRDRDLPMNRFPTQPPGPNERILPDGRVVQAPSQ